MVTSTLASVISGGFRRLWDPGQRDHTACRPASAPPPDALLRLIPRGAHAAVRSRGARPVSGSSATMNKAPVNIRARDSGWTEAPVSSGSVTGLGKQDKQQRDYLAMLLPKVLGDVTCAETRREGLGH